MSVPVPKVLLFGGILLMFINGRSSTDERSDVKNCSSLKLSFESTASKISQTRFDIKLHASGGEPPYYYIFLDTKGIPVSSDNSKKDFENLEAGSYRTILVDSEDCKKELYLEIK
jgi:hypothetical protein